MNARQKAKKLKKKINTLKSDNDLMREIIADSPAMQELYDVYSKPKFVTHTTMHFDEYLSRRSLPPDRPYDVEIIEATKRVIINDLFKIIAENITCEIDDESANPTITARIFIGTEQGEE